MGKGKKKGFLKKKLSELSKNEKLQFYEILGKVICKRLFNSEDLNKFISFIKDFYKNTPSFKDGLGDFDTAAVKSFYYTLAEHNGIEVNKKGLDYILGMLSLTSIHPLVDQWGTTMEDALEKIVTQDKEQSAKTREVIDNSILGKQRRKQVKEWGKRRWESDFIEKDIKLEKQQWLKYGKEIKERRKLSTRSAACEVRKKLNLPLKRFQSIYKHLLKNNV